jgi:hypothetical protein
MSHGVRRLSRNEALRLDRRPLRWLKPWCEWIALLTTVALAYTRLRMEIGNCQALFASAGVPLAVLDGPRGGMLVARRIPQRLGDALVAHSRRSGGPALWISPHPLG